jgi:hypothetical protein
MRANVSAGAKHDRSKSLILTNNLSAVMLRPYKIGILPFDINCRDTALPCPLYHADAVIENN